MSASILALTELPCKTGPSAHPGRTPEAGVLTINTFSSAFQFNGVRALLLGLLCGISEIALRDVVGGRADDFVKRLAIQKAAGV